MTKQIYVGSVPIGGGAAVTVQSMCSAKTSDVPATVDQIHRLEEAGCEIIRVAAPDMDAAKAIGAIKSRIHIPLVADIHFDYKLALACVEQGADKIRINPGNIGGEDRVKLVADACRERKIPIRIGVNGGSLEKELRAKYGGVTAEALAESALGHAALLEKFGFDSICISVKCSSVPVTIGAYRLLSERCPYPLHLGVTEAGTPSMGMIKSAMGIGGLLCLGIGDTLRVTLTADPVERRLAGCTQPITVAVMGCAVNGPGEAAAADVGIAGGKGEGLLFRKGAILRKVPQEHLVDALMAEIEKMTADLHRN